MGNKAEELFEVWKKYSKYRWKEKLKEVGVVSEEDVNGFLMLVGEKEEWWYANPLGWFVSLVLEECYTGRFIELDVGLVNGWIDVGHELDWDGVVYVKESVDGDVGWYMERGYIIVNGDVKGFVGYGMKGGMVVVEGEVTGSVGRYMEGGVIVVKGSVRKAVGWGMEGGEIVVDGAVRKRGWLEELGSGGLVVNNGFVYFGRMSR